MYMRVSVSWKWVVLWSLWAARLVRQPTAELRVRSGLVRGSVAHNGAYAEYLAIPYATIVNRFQESKLVPPWEGTFEAYQEHVRCTQRFSKHMISGQEDCLTLNVYTPPPQPGDVTRRPVMVFIHGGGFRDGSGSPLLYGPDYLVPHGVILVTINYRLEVLGFLCLGIEEAPGNVGLKDQVAALRWVQQNIEVFGGNPNDVTLFGESAGSASVVYHLISPMSKGLFHKVIMQSGSATAPWAFQFEPLKTARLLAKQMGYDTQDSREIYKIFRNKTDVELLSTRVPRAKGDVVLSENVFVPCVEQTIPGVQSFLTDLPYNLLSKGKYAKMPMIIGYNDAEGYMFVGKENDTTKENFDFYNGIPRDLHFPNEEERIKTAERLKQMYIGDKEYSKDMIDELARFEGDAGITYSVISTIEMLLKTNIEPIYTYKMCYSGWLNLAKLVFASWKTRGATHADELFYMFKTRATLINSFFETEMIKKVSTLWSNFAKFGNPTPAETSVLPKWRPTDKTNPQVLVINEKFSTAPLWDDEIMLFWNKTYSKYRRKV
ncbi:esterase FE4-like [Pectinophora gossypiella]|uniref:esterase FE4-like n=1 Tax=Pectinophora gossypiella TaxID=13191 RepID=UPI00214E40B4|nr:esterase FE4-like [Pectinophora gossypiella]XP_049876917.1 esterase FE4-like [Pectinophora gossypiella]